MVEYFPNLERRSTVLTEILMTCHSMITGWNHKKWGHNIGWCDQGRKIFAIMMACDPSRWLIRWIRMDPANHSFSLSLWWFHYLVISLPCDDTFLDMPQIPHPNFKVQISRCFDNRRTYFPSKLVKEIYILYIIN